MICWILSGTDKSTTAYGGIYAAVRRPFLANTGSLRSGTVWTAWQREGATIVGTVCFQWRTVLFKGREKAQYRKLACTLYVGVRLNSAIR